MQTASQVAHRARVDLKGVFLATLRDTGNITASCMVAGFNRKTAYKWRESDKEFAELWDISLEIAVDKLEYVARNRAIKGVKKPIYYKGELIDHVYEPSDRLMELLLKAHRPDKFNPVQKLEHSGGVTVNLVDFTSGVTQPLTIEGDVVSVEREEPGVERCDVGSTAQGASMPEGDDLDTLFADLERGGLFEGGTPKLDSRENDEGCHLADFSDLKK